MPLRTKKWTRSKANMYISRSKSCKKLQVSLPSFRKLCILKGIYPHDPKKKHKREGDRRVYYHRRDIKLLHREPILWQWRKQRTFRNKITKHKGRHNWSKVKGMTLNMPQISLDHLVRERYPKFNDALRDFDDCATFISLFATLPSGIIPLLTAIKRLECQKLVKEFRNYIIKNGLLTKAFISVKGIYYQCRIKNHFNITWIVPHHFAHSVPDDVDFRVMSSFLDFYQTMFKFVIFKLYKESNMKYPPFGFIDYDLTNLSLTALMNGEFARKRKINIHRNRNRKNKYKSKDNDTVAMGGDIENNLKSEKPKIVQLDLTEIVDANELDVEYNSEKTELNEKYKRQKWDRSNLFEDFKFLLNRETPQFELEFVILSMGGKVIFQQDCDTLEKECDVSITHQIVDRKMCSDMLLNTREYIQPQWVFDCLNTGAVIPSEHYQMGIQCPPHLSPFEVYNDQSHIPSQHFVLEHWKKISKQFGGFVPGKKLRDRKEKIDGVIEKGKEVKDENENEIEMNLDIAEIMDMDEVENDGGNDGIVAENEGELDEFVESESESGGDNAPDDTWEWSGAEEEEEKRLMELEEKRRMEKKGTILEKQRITIAHRERGKVMKDLRDKHGLEKDGIPKNKEERIKVELAKSMMSKKYKKIYNKISRNKKRKSKHLKYLDEKRKKYEQKQMHSRH